MRYLSDKMTAALAENSTMVPKATLRLADGTYKYLSGNDFCSMSVEQSSSSSGSFDIGAAIVGRLSCTLNNYDDRFSEYDFTGALLSVSVGKKLSDGTTEWVQLGIFIVDQPDSYAGQISLTALDYMSKFEKNFDASSVTWPATLQQLARYACNKIGMTLGTPEIPNGSYSVTSMPDLSDATYLDLMGYIAQATGTFVRANSNGQIVFEWYDLEAFEGEDSLDGGRFDGSDPYSSGDKADGGNFTDYSSGYSADGGDFANMRRVGRINAFTSMTVFTDDVVITGVKVTAANEIKVDEGGNETNGENGETSLYGKEGYVLSIEGNPLVLYGQAAKVAEQVGKRVVGMRFRPFSASCVTDPSLEPGDAVVVTDRKDNIYQSYITMTSLSVNGSESVECSAESASRNSASSASAATKAVVAARNDLKREQTAREIAQKDLAGQIENAAGLYSTSVKQDDGSYIYYLHDKSDLQSSKIVWKMTANAMAVSTAGPSGPYVTGLTADGTAILKRIYAIGIDADYVTTGTLASKDGSNYINLDTGESRLALKDDSTVGGKTVSTIAKDATAALTQQQVFDKLTGGGSTQGLYLQDGKLYLNGSYIKSGEIDADYINVDTLAIDKLTSSNASSTFKKGVAKVTAKSNKGLLMRFTSTAGDSDDDPVIESQELSWYETVNGTTTRKVVDGIEVASGTNATATEYGESGTRGLLFVGDNELRFRAARLDSSSGGELKTSLMELAPDKFNVFLPGLSSSSIKNHFIRCANDGFSLSFGGTSITTSSDQAFKLASDGGSVILRPNGSIRIEGGGSGDKAVISIDSTYMEFSFGNDFSLRLYKSGSATIRDSKGSHSLY